MKIAVGKVYLTGALIPATKPTSGGVPEAVMDFTGVPFTPIPF
jgi:hypothetical protein